LSQITLIMDYTEILSIAESKLNPEYYYVINEIKLKISSGSTGGEIGSLVGGYLKKIKYDKHPAYLLLKDDIDLFLSQFRFID
jgi:hypothetical protein